MKDTIDSGGLGLIGSTSSRVAEVESFRDRRKLIDERWVIEVRKEETKKNNKVVCVYFYIEVMFGEGST